MSEAGHGRRVASMATGTLASRLTGLLRVLVLAWVLGFTPLADAFNLANTVPNMLFDLVLGGIASATFIPVFVERLSLDGERKAWRSISSVLTLSFLVLVISSGLAWVGAPWIVDGLTLMHHHVTAAGLVRIAHEREVATQLLRWFVPQIFFYGLIGLATALLNVRRKFGVASWVPVANNVVSIAVLVWFHLVDAHPTLSSVASTQHLMWLGLGTSAGVAVQFFLLTPSLAKADLWRISFRLDLHDPAVRAVGRLGAWTLAVVVANQVALFVVLAFAFGAGGNGPVSAYTYGWSFMQMPYAVVVVSVIGVLTPQLAQHATDGNFEALSERLRFGLRQSLVIIVPATIVLITLAQPLVAILLHHLDASSRLPAGTVLAILAAGLPGFTVFQLCVRGLQSMQRAREVFWLYAVENALNIALAFVIGRTSLSGLTASVSLAYTATAVIALVVLRQHKVHIAGAIWGVHVRRSLLASVIAGLAMVIVYAAFTSSVGLGLLERFGATVVTGLGAYVSTVNIAQGRATRSRRKMQGLQSPKGSNGQRTNRH